MSLEVDKFIGFMGALPTVNDIYAIVIPMEEEE
jgi:hypothetical protein